MAQNKIIMAFRKRAKSYGYKEISIRAMEDGGYYVQAVEPMTGTLVSKEYPSMYDLHVLFRHGIPTSK